MTDENTGGFNSSTAYVVTEGTEKSQVIGLTHVAGYEDTDYFAGQNKLYVNMISLYSDARCFSRKIGSEKKASGNPYKHRNHAQQRRCGMSRECVQSDQGVHMFG